MFTASIYLADGSRHAGLLELDKGDGEGHWEVDVAAAIFPPSARGGAARSRGTLASIRPGGRSKSTRVSVYRFMRPRYVSDGNTPSASSARTMGRRDLRRKPWVWTATCREDILHVRASACSDMLVRRMRATASTAECRAEHAQGDSLDEISSTQYQPLSTWRRRSGCETRRRSSSTNRSQSSVDVLRANRGCSRQSRRELMREGEHDSAWTRFKRNAGKTANSRAGSARHDRRLAALRLHHRRSRR